MFSCFTNAQQENSSYDTTFNSYLTKIRKACELKDTFKLHQLFGDNAYTNMSNEEDSMQSLSKWDVFQNKFDLNANPEKSTFWGNFIHKCDQSFYFDSVMKKYQSPDVYFQKIGYVVGYPIRGIAIKIIAKDTVDLLVGTQLSNTTKTVFVPKKVWETHVYPYNLVNVNEDYYICSENGVELGFIAAKDLALWNFHMLFDKIKGNWQLVYYEYVEK